MSEGPLLQMQFQIELQSAAHIGTGLGLGQLLDDRIVQGPHPAYPRAIVPYVPGSTLKGRVRYHLRQMAEIFELPEVEDRLFGSAEHPGDLRVADAHLSDLALVGRLSADTSDDTAQAGRPSPLGQYLVHDVRSFVSLSRGRRVARDERLFRIELAETGLVFTGTISGRLWAAQPEQDLALLCAAIRELSHLGGHKGRGLGHCQITITETMLDGAWVDWHTLIEERL